MHGAKENLSGRRNETCTCVTKGLENNRKVMGGRTLTRQDMQMLMKTGENVLKIGVNFLVNDVKEHFLGFIVWRCPTLTLKFSPKPKSWDLFTSGNDIFVVLFVFSSPVFRKRCDLCEKDLITCFHSRCQKWWKKIQEKQIICLIQRCLKLKRIYSNLGLWLEGISVMAVLEK